MTRPGPLRRSGPPLALAVGAGVLNANFVLDWVRRGPETLGHTVSELAAPGEPQAWLYRTGEVGCAVLVLRLLPRAGRALPPGLGREVFTSATAVFAASAAVAGVVPTPQGPSSVDTGSADASRPRPRNGVHEAASIVSTASLYLAMGASWLATRRGRPAWFHRATGATLGAGAACNLVFGATQSSADRRRVAGISQRGDILAASVWLSCLGPLAARPVADAHLEERGAT